MADDSKLEILLRTYEHNQGWIHFADTKAGVVLAASGVLAGFVLGQLEQIRYAEGMQHALTILAVAAYAVAQSTAFVFAIQVFFPRRPVRDYLPTRLVFPVGIQQGFPAPGDGERFADEFAAASVDELERQYARQLHVDALVGRAKYASLGRALIALFVTVPFATLALALLAMA